MATEIITALAIVAIGVAMMISGTKLCSYSCSVDEFFDWFLPESLESLAGGLPLVVIGVGLLLHSLRRIR